MLKRESSSSHHPAFSYDIHPHHHMQFSELRDNQWEFIRPHIPPKAHTGRPREDDRTTINGILYVLLSGCRWMDMPPRYGSHKTFWERHKKCSGLGVWKAIMDSLVSHGYQKGLVRSATGLLVLIETTDPRLFIGINPFFMLIKPNHQWR